MRSLAHPKKLLVTFVLGFLVVFFSLKFLLISGPVVYFWPASGLFLGLTFLWGRQLIPVVFLASFSANLLTHFQVEQSLGFSLGAAFQAFVGSLLFKELIHQKALKQWSFGIYSVLSFFCCALLGFIGSLIAFSVLALIGPGSTAFLLEALAIGTVSDALGILFFLPVMLRLKELAGNWQWLRNTWLWVGLIALSIVLLGLSLHALSREMVFFIFAIQIYFAKNKKLPTQLLIGTYIYLLTIFLFRIEGVGVDTDGGFHNLVFLQIFLLVVSILSLALEELRDKKLIQYSFNTLLGSFIFGALVFSAYYYAEKEQDRARLEELITNFERKVKSRMRAYIDGLEGGKSLIYSGSTFNYQIWRNFVTQLDLLNRYPGIHGLGAIIRVKKEELKEYLQFAKSHYPPEFSLKSVPNVRPPLSNEHYVISLVEPSEASVMALGLDVASEEHRKEAADLSAATGKPVATRMVHLVQDQKRRPGFLLFLPTRLIGQASAMKAPARFFDFDWIYAPFIVDDFLKDPVEEAQKELRMRIYDTDAEDQPIAKQRLFSNTQEFENFHPLRKNQILEIAQRKWFIEYATTPQFLSNRHYFSSSLLLVVLALGLTLSGMVGSIRSTAQVAEDRARELSAKVVYTSKMAALGEMASGMAHELNNPMMIVMGGGNQMKRMLNAEGNLDRQQLKSLLGRIEVAIERMARVVEGLAQFSKDGGKTELRLVSIAEILADSLSLVRTKFEKAKISLRESKVPDVFIECQPLQIIQVLHNLLMNSYDAIESLEAPWVELEYLVSSKNIEIRVMDSGKGIPHEVVEKMMQPFFSTKPIGKGVGLGLSECKGIIESHHGEFYYDGSCKNTTFVIRLPLPSASTPEKV